MRPDVEAATERVKAKRARLLVRPNRIDPQEIEDELCVGYAHALDGDAWLTEADERLHGLIDDASSPVRGRELRALAAEHSEFQRSVIALRHELAALRREHDRLRDSSRAA